MASGNGAVVVVAEAVAAPRRQAEERVVPLLERLEELRPRRVELRPRRVEERRLPPGKDVARHVEAPPRRAEERRLPPDKGVAQLEAAAEAGCH
jgi:hypothetical protein